ncbi:MAG: RIO1 family regulatory kinase/ATPase [Chloroflexota bacterium]
MTNNYYDELDDDDFIGILATKSHRIQPPSSRYSNKVAEKMRKFIQLQDDSRENFKFTYKAARFEEGWLLKSLGGFYEHKWISDVLRRIKGGKEASVYLCKAGAEVNEDLVAVKVYRPRSLRNLKNDHAYREGRDDLDAEGKIVLNDGMQHAMAKRTEYGKNLLHQSWIAYEFTSMQVLRRAGADVPIPYEMADNAILMGYIGDIDSCAPTLNEVSLARDEAYRIFERVLHNIDILLNNEKIHGDLSAYNILYWEGEITLIDFPQVVSPKINRNAFLIFQRDITRVCEYFIKQGVKVNPRTIAADMWVKHGYKIEPEIDIRLLNAEDPQDWALWQKQSRGK